MPLFTSGSKGGWPPILFAESNEPVLMTTSFLMASTVKYLSRNAVVVDIAVKYWVALLMMRKPATPPPWQLMHFCRLLAASVAHAVVMFAALKFSWLMQPDHS